MITYQENFKKYKTNLKAKIQHQEIEGSIKNQILKIIDVYDKHKPIQIDERIQKQVQQSGYKYISRLREMSEKTQFTNQEIVMIESECLLLQIFCQIHQYSNLIQKRLIQAILWPQSIKFKLKWSQIVSMTKINKYEAKLKTELPQLYRPSNHNFASQKQLKQIYTILKKQFNPDKLYKYLSSKGKQYQKILQAAIVFGKTGSGKSTLIQQLLGYIHILSTDKDKGYTLQTTVQLRQEHKQIIAARGSVSVTSDIHMVKISKNELNNIVNLRQDLILVDCPGYNDSRGNDIDIANNFLRKKLVTVSENIVIIEVIDINALHTGRDNPIKALAHQIKNKYGYNSFAELNQFLILIFNNCTWDNNDIFYRKDLQNYAIENKNAIIRQSNRTIEDDKLYHAFQFINKQLSLKPGYNFVEKINYQLSQMPQQTHGAFFKSHQRKIMTKRRQILQLISQKTFTQSRECLISNLDAANENVLNHAITEELQKLDYYLHHKYFKQAMYQLQMIKFLEQLANDLQYSKNAERKITSCINSVLQKAIEMIKSYQIKDFFQNYNNIRDIHSNFETIIQLPSHFYKKQLRNDYETIVTKLMQDWRDKILNPSIKEQKQKTILQNQVNLFKHYCSLFKKSPISQVADQSSSQLQHKINHCMSKIPYINLSNENLIKQLQQIQIIYKQIEASQTVYKCLADKSLSNTQNILQKCNDSISLQLKHMASKLKEQWNNCKQYFMRVSLNFQQHYSNNQQINSDLIQIFQLQKKFDNIDNVCSIIRVIKEKQNINTKNEIIQFYLIIQKIYRYFKKKISQIQQNNSNVQKGQLFIKIISSFKQDIIIILKQQLSKQFCPKILELDQQTKQCFNSKIISALQSMKTIESLINLGLQQINYSILKKSSLQAKPLIKNISIYNAFLQQNPSKRNNTIYHQYSQISSQESIFKTIIEKILIKINKLKSQIAERGDQNNLQKYIMNFAKQAIYFRNIQQCLAIILNKQTSPLANDIIQVQQVILQKIFKVLNHCNTQLSNFGLTILKFSPKLIKINQIMELLLKISNIINIFLVIQQQIKPQLRSKFNLLKQQLHNFFKNINENIQNNQLKNNFAKFQDNKDGKLLQPLLLQKTYIIYGKIMQNESNYYIQKIDKKIHIEIIQNKVKTVLENILQLLRKKDIDPAEDKQSLQLKLDQYKRIDQLIYLRKERLKKQSVKSKIQSLPRLDSVNNTNEQNQSIEFNYILSEIQNLFLSIDDENMEKKIYKFFQRMQLSQFNIRKFSVQYKKIQNNPKFKILFEELFHTYLKKKISIVQKNKSQYQYQSNRQNLYELLKLSQKLQQFQSNKQFKKCKESIDKKIKQMNKQIKSQFKNHIQICNNYIKQWKLQQSKIQLQKIKNMNNQALDCQQNEQVKKLQIRISSKLQIQQNALSKTILTSKCIVDLNNQQRQCHYYLAFKNVDFKNSVRKSIQTIISNYQRFVDSRSQNISQIRPFLLQFNIFKQYAYRTVEERRLLGSIKPQLDIIQQGLLNLFSEVFAKFNNKAQIIQQNYSQQCIYKTINYSKDLCAISKLYRCKDNIRQQIQNLSKSYTNYFSKMFKKIRQQSDIIKAQELMQRNLKRLLFLRENNQIQQIIQLSDYWKQQIHIKFQQLYNNLYKKIQVVFTKHQLNQTISMFIKDFLKILCLYKRIFISSQQYKQTFQNFIQKLKFLLERYQQSYNKGLVLSKYLQQQHNNSINDSQSQIIYQKISKELQLSFYYQGLKKFIQVTNEFQIQYKQKWITFYQEIQEMFKFFRLFDLSPQFMFNHRYSFTRKSQIYNYIESLHKKQQFLKKVLKIEVKVETLMQKQIEIVNKYTDFNSIFFNIMQDMKKHHLEELGSFINNVNHQDTENIILKIQYYWKKTIFIDRFLSKTYKDQTYVTVEQELKNPDFLKKSSQQINYLLSQKKLSISHFNCIQQSQINSTISSKNIRKYLIKQKNNNYFGFNRVLKFIMSKIIKENLTKTTQLQQHPPIFRQNSKEYFFYMQYKQVKDYLQYQERQNDNRTRLSFVKIYSQKLTRNKPFAIILAFLSKIFPQNKQEIQNTALQFFSKLSNSINTKDPNNFLNNVAQISHMGKLMISLAFVMYFSLNGDNVYFSHSNKSVLQLCGKKLRKFFNQIIEIRHNKIVFNQLKSLLQHKLTENDKINKGTGSSKVNPQSKKKTRDILLFEIQDIFTHQFLKQVYQYRITLSDSTNSLYKHLLQQIWQVTKAYRQQKKKINGEKLTALVNKVKQGKVYKQIRKCKDFKQLINKQLTKMIMSSINFDQSFSREQRQSNQTDYNQYDHQNDLKCLVQLESQNGQQVAYGYKTIFYQFKKYQQKKLNEIQLNKMIKLRFKYAEISYLHMLQLFKYKFMIATTSSSELIPILQQDNPHTIISQNHTNFPEIQDNNLQFWQKNDLSDILRIINEIDQRNLIICFQNYHQLKCFYLKHLEQLKQFTQKFLFIDQLQQQQQLIQLKWESFGVFANVLLITKPIFINLNTNNNELFIRNKQIQFILTYLPAYKVQYNLIRSKLQYLSSQNMFKIVITPQQARKMPFLIQQIQNKSLQFMNKLIQNQKELIKIAQNKKQRMIKNPDSLKTVRKFHQEMVNNSSNNHNFINDNNYHKQLMFLDQYKKLIIAIDSGYVSPHWDILLSFVVEKLFQSYSHKLLLKIVIFRSYQSGQDILSYTGYESDCFILTKFIKDSLRYRKDCSQHQMKCFQYIYSQLKRQNILNCIVFVASNPSYNCVQAENSKRINLAQNRVYQFQTNMNKGQLLNEIQELSRQKLCKLHFFHVSQDGRSKFNGENEYKYLSNRFETSFNRVVFKEIGEAYMNISETLKAILSN